MHPWVVFTLTYNVQTKKFPLLSGLSCRFGSESRFETTVSPVTFAQLREIAKLRVR